MLKMKPNVYKVMNVFHEFLMVCKSIAKCFEGKHRLRWKVLKQKQHQIRVNWAKTDSTKKTTFVCIYVAHLFAIRDVILSFLTSFLIVLLFTSFLSGFDSFIQFLLFSGLSYASFSIWVRTPKSNWMWNGSLIVPIQVFSTFLSFGICRILAIAIYILYLCVVFLFVCCMLNLTLVSFSFLFYFLFSLCLSLQLKSVNKEYIKLHSTHMRCC